MTRLCLAILISVTLAACGDVEDTKEYQTGYDAGYSDGHDDGKAEGIEAGIETGKEEICDQVQTQLNYGAANAVGC